MTPKVFISYSHDSPEHESRVLALANRLRLEGVDADLDQYNGAPPGGWLRWMEARLMDADFVLLVCSETYLRRVTGKEQQAKGNGVVWEATLIYNLLYSEKLDTHKFVPVLFQGSSRDNIPLPIRGFSSYRIDEDADYLEMYRLLTSQPGVTKPALGRLRSVPAKEKSQQSLPGAFLLEKLSKTMSNPK